MKSLSVGAIIIFLERPNRKLETTDELIEAYELPAPQQRGRYCFVLHFVRPPWSCSDEGGRIWEVIPPHLTRPETSDKPDSHI